MCLQYKILESTCQGERKNGTQNFSFSDIVFLPFGELSAIFIKFKILICKVFQFGHYLIDRVEIIVEKSEKADYFQYLLLFLCFLKVFSKALKTVLKDSIVS